MYSANGSQKDLREIRKDKALENPPNVCCNIDKSGVIFVIRSLSPVTRDFCTLRSFLYEYDYIFVVKCSVIRSFDKTSSYTDKNP